ncbi:MAG: cell division protein SepF [Candidatus Aenigmatarchaeota archaeon]
MPIKDLLGKNKEAIGDEELVEISHEHSEQRVESVPIKIVQLEEYNDAEEVQKSVREGNIVFAKIKKLKEKDMSELKRAIERIRKTCTAVDGDIAGVDDNYIIVAPEYARIVRNGPEE